MRINIYTYPIRFGHTARMMEPGKTPKENQDSFVHGLLNILVSLFMQWRMPHRELFPTLVRATDPRLGTKSLPAQRCCGIFSLVLEATCVSFLQRCVPYHFSIVVHIPVLALHLACSAHRGHLRPARRVLELLGCLSLGWAFGGLTILMN